MNLDAYTLEYAPVSDRENFTPIQPPSRVHVANSLFTSWLPPGAGDYIVKLVVRDKAGNETTRIERIFWQETLPIANLKRSPEHFSPNSDGENDYFYVQGLGIEELKLVIYDRWGEKVFENNGFKANDIYVGWDGTYRGKLMNPAVFVYIVTGTFIDGSEIKENGDFTLIK